MAEDVVYDGSPEATKRLFEMHPQGAKFLCPQCRAELIVALTWSEGISRRVRPGVYCPNDLGHVCENFILDRR